MSCQIINLEAIAALANGLEKLLNMGVSYSGMEAPQKLYDALRKSCADRYGFFQAKLIYKELFALNVRAYNGRYRKEEDEADTEASGAEIEKYHVFTRSEYAAEGGRYIICPWHYEFLKLVECYVHQVSEDATRDTSLKSAMVEVAQCMCKFIVRNSLEYVAAPWGQI